MEPVLLLAFVLGFAVSVLSGMLGIGGGILLAPALLYLPVLLGMEGIGMAEVTGLTIVQSLTASTTAGYRHQREGFVDRQLVIWMGGALALTAVAGSILSSVLPGEALKLVFAGLAAAAAGLMLLPRAKEDDVVPEKIAFDRPKAVGIASGVGLLGGLVGQGGSFILIPLMLHVLKLPTRVVIGTSLILVLLSSLAGFVGKFATGQVPVVLAVCLVLGAVPGALIGSSVGLKTRPDRLRLLLAGVVALGASGIGIDALS